MLPDLITLFTRDLNKLKQEITAYSDESNLWKTDKNIINSGGNLCLHLIGNLHTFIGAALGNTGYIRQRPLEFSSKDVPRAQLLTEIDEVIEVVITALEHLPEAALTEEFPILVFKEPTNTGFMLMHLTTHLTYHLGQINYHRRLLD